MGSEIRIGISSCLLGNPVRYNGGHTLDRYLRDILGPFVEYYAVCPEVECGLPVPRESMHLTGDPTDPRLVTVRSGIDHTERMLTWTGKKLDGIEEKDLCGFIFKTGSPSSGMRSIRVYNGKSIHYNGTGLFARAFMDRFPMIPVEDEGRLQDPVLRENFIQRVFVFHHWKEAMREGCSPGRLVDFHTRHKLLVMSHDARAVSALGRLTADPDRQNPQHTCREYFEMLMKTLARPATAKRHANVLYHILGYFKDQLSSDEKEEMTDLIEQYRTGLVPLVVPITLLNHHVRRFDQPYLQQQYYLRPHPVELMLRNRV